MFTISGFNEITWIFKFSEKERRAEFNAPIFISIADKLLRLIEFASKNVSCLFNLNESLSAL